MKHWAMDSRLSGILIERCQETGHIRESDHRSLIEALQVEVLQEAVDPVSSTSHPKCIEIRVTQAPFQILQTLCVRPSQIAMASVHPRTKYALEASTLEERDGEFEPFSAVDTGRCHDSDSGTGLQGLWKGLHPVQRIACRVPTRLGEGFSQQPMRNPCSEH
jgi:hypothetical protein